jgi:hypothetical protein
MHLPYLQDWLEIPTTPFPTPLGTWKQQVIFETAIQYDWQPIPKSYSCLILRCENHLPLCSCNVLWWHLFLENWTSLMSFPDHPMPTISSTPYHILFNNWPLNDPIQAHGYINSSWGDCLITAAPLQEPSCDSLADQSPTKQNCNQQLLGVAPKVNSCRQVTQVVSPYMSEAFYMGFTCSATRCYYRVWRQRRCNSNGQHRQTHTMILPYWYQVLRTARMGRMWFGGFEKYWYFSQYVECLDEASGSYFILSPSRF